MARSVLAAGCCLLAVALSACATAGGAFRLPSGPWVAEADAAGAYDEALAPCRGVTSVTAEIAVRGRAGGTKVRGRLIAGLERGGSMRLEAPAPFGAPVFVLAARANRATLWLPRAKQVVRDAPVDDVLEALTGLRRSSDDVLGLVAGCPPETVRDGTGAVGRRNGEGWLEVDLGGGATAYLRHDTRRWRLVAARGVSPAGGEAWFVSYAGYFAGLPRTITVRQDDSGSGRAGAVTELTFTVSQPEVNVPIDAAAFDLVLPPGVELLSIDDLRQAGPLADRGEAGRDGR